MKSEAMPFVAPLFLFALFLSVEGYFPDQHYVLYPVVTVMVAAALAWFWRSLPPMVPTAPLGSFLVGVAGIILWVGLDPWAMRLDALLEGLFNAAVSSLGLDSWRVPLDPVHPLGRNPFLLYPAAEAWILFGFRLAGISLCVPIMEELFWRGFLMRWLIREDFTSVPIGTYQPASFWITTAFFALVHGPEWPLGIVVGVLYGIWFVRTKSLGNIMLAHGVTNLLLALYCLASGDWHFLSTVTTTPALK
jgi:membrane protease YdiL (CAAX protease family)